MFKITSETRFHINPHFTLAFSNLDHKSDLKMKNN